MSTKTTFKRIALVAVAALGLGVLSVAPSSATILTQSVTLASAPAVATINDTTTAVLAESFYSSAAEDSVTITGVITSSNSASASVRLAIATTDSSTSAGVVAVAGNYTSSIRISSTGLNKTTTANVSAYLVNPQVAGTYTVTFYVQRSNDGAALGSADSAVLTWSTTVAAANTAATGASKAIVRFGSAALSDDKADSSTIAVKTGTGAVGYTVYVKEVNSVGLYANESITAVVTGNAFISATNARGTGTALTLANTQSATGTPIYVFSNGTAGTATLTIMTPSYSFPVKTLKFSGAATKLAVSTAIAPKTVIKTTAGTSTSNVAIIAVTDANGYGLSGTQAFTVTSSETAQIASASVGAYDVLLGGYPLSTISGAAATSGKAVTLTVTIADPADTTGVAKLTTTHAVTMGGAVAKEVIAFDKASYSPGEQAIITITATDASGNPVYTGAAAPALSSNKTIQGITNVAGTYTAGKADSVSRDVDNSVLNTYTLFAPATGGDFKVYATGTDALATLISATATVQDAATNAATDAANEATDAANAATDAALAAADAADAATAAAQDASDAVAALSATVDKLVASLKAQITSLTNLVIKIQKKVKA